MPGYANYSVVLILAAISIIMCVRVCVCVCVRVCVCVCVSTSFQSLYSALKIQRPKYPFTLKSLSVSACMPACLSLFPFPPKSYICLCLCLYLCSIFKFCHSLNERIFSHIIIWESKRALGVCVCVWLKEQALRLKPLST